MILTARVVPAGVRAAPGVGVPLEPPWAPAHRLQHRIYLVTESIWSQYLGNLKMWSQNMCTCLATAGLALCVLAARVGGTRLQPAPGRRVGVAHVACIGNVFISQQLL